MMLNGVMRMGDDFRKKLQEQSKSGFHKSDTDMNDHYTIKNAQGDTVEHDYGNGLVKRVNKKEP